VKTRVLCFEKLAYFGDRFGPSSSGASSDTHALISDNSSHVNSVPYQRFTRPVNYSPTISPFRRKSRTTFRPANEEARRRDQCATGIMHLPSPINKCTELPCRHTKFYICPLQRYPRRKTDRKDSEHGLGADKPSSAYRSNPQTGLGDSLLFDNLDVGTRRYVRLARITEV